MIGLAVGDGTGEELALVFRRAVERLGAVHRRSVEIATCPRRFSTYGTVAAEDLSPTDVANLAERDAVAYAEWLRSRFKAGTRVVFRTAFNAQSLYLVREALWAVKPESFVHPTGELLLVRDEMQGFYTGRNCDPAADHDRIRRTCEFRRDRTHRVLDFARAEAAAHWGSDDRAARLVAAYKFHLLDRRFERWICDYAARRGVAVELYQPDTTNRHLLKGTFAGRVVIVGANEWVDVVHTELITRFGLGHQEERWSRNVYLADEVAGLEEYQTVHGSADDIAGEDRVNPLATLRAVAALLERHAGCAQATSRMERAIDDLGTQGLATPDLGGTATTAEVTAAALDAYEQDGATRRRHHAARPVRSSALVVIDLQNDFCAPDGHFARRGLIDPTAMADVTDRIEAAVARARIAGTHVIFVRMLADPSRIPSVMSERNRREGHIGHLAPGGLGSEFFRVLPLHGEQVITKVGYDPFLAPEFEAHLERAGIDTLTLVGAFADVCVDAAARTGYQKGFRIQVLEDCTIALERPTADALAFMARFYGADILPAETWPAAAASPREGGEADACAHPAVGAQARVSWADA